MLAQQTLFVDDSHNPGASLSLPAGMDGSAIFSGDKREYRLELKRTWDVRLPTMLLVMMNPSTADTNFNDPTVAKGCRYAKGWGYGKLLVGNVFAFRSTSPKGLLACDDPVGPNNNAHLLLMAMEAQLIVFAYGKPHKSLQWRGPQVADMFERAGHQLHILHLCADGTPSHPLYLKGDLNPQLWKRPS